VFIKKEDTTINEQGQGFFRRTAVTGSSIQMVEFTLMKGATVPLHSHAQEQVGSVISGKLRFTIGAETLLIGAGDSYRIGGNIQHGAIVVEDAVVIDVFSPPREDYRE
jgi:quercetin dioxygenase-like cupin family protein